MPLWKTDSGKDKQTIQPKRWTLVRFDGETVFPVPDKGRTTYSVILRVEYPISGCATTLRGRYVRWPNTNREDETGHNDVNPVPGLVRHHKWDHFLLNRPDMNIGFKVWHNGVRSIVLDGRQFKTADLR